MADRSASRLPLVWRAGDPEPSAPIRVRCTCCAHTWMGTPLRPWKRISRPHLGVGDYRWWNGDKLRSWDMLTRNHGPLVNVDRLRRLHAAYGRRRRHG